MSRLWLFLLVAATATVSRTPRAGITAAQAESLAEKLESLEALARSSPKAERRVELTEGEVNSYVNLTLAPTLPAGLRDVDLQLARDRLVASASVDIDEVKKQLGDLSPWNPLTLVTGRVPVEVSGRYLTAADGFGRVEIEEARAAGVPVPIPMLEQMVAAATRTSSDPDGFDIHAPFRLPSPVRRVRLLPGKALLDL